MMLTCDLLCIPTCICTERRKKRSPKNASAERKRAMAIALVAAGFTEEEIYEVLGL